LVGQFLAAAPDTSSSASWQSAASAALLPEADAAAGTAADSPFWKIFFWGQQPLRAVF
jgi:hypothetical protein